MPIFAEGRRRRLAPLLAVLVFLTAPTGAALAIDTGGGGGSDTLSGPSFAPPAAAGTPAPMAPSVIDLDSARKLIARKQWQEAVKLLRVIVVQQPHNADAFNLLGFSLRQQGHMQEAEGFYFKALALQPDHLGANEYLGELYAMTGQMQKAKARLTTIARICGSTRCEAYRDLAKAIAAHA